MNGTSISITFGRILGTRMLFMPSSLTLIFRHKLDSVCGDVLLTFLAWTHCVAIPKTVSPTLFTSAGKTHFTILAGTPPDLLRHNSSSAKNVESNECTTKNLPAMGKPF